MGIGVEIVQLNEEVIKGQIKDKVRIIETILDHPLIDKYSTYCYDVS